jgi:hypothetical protein
MKFNKIIVMPYFLLLFVNSTACASAETNRTVIRKDHKMENKTLSDSTILDSLLSIDKSRFIGNAVDSFLNNKTIPKYQEYIFVDGKPGMLTGLNLKYSDNIFVELEVTQFKHMNPFDVNRKWRLDELRKEKISEIRIIYNNKEVEVKHK